MTTQDDLRDRIQTALYGAGHRDLAAALDTAMPLVAAYAKNGDSILYDNEWLQMRETPDGYVYSHENKSDGQGVAVLAYRRRDQDVFVAGRYENTPCHRDGLALTSLTGLMDKPGESPAECAARELREEAGIEVQAKDLQPLGTVRPSKQADTTLHLFSVDVTDTPNDRPLSEDVEGDGTSGEQGAYCRWVTVTDACLSKSPVLATLAVRAFMIGRY